MDRIYVLESKGNHLDASVCYEEAISKDPQNVKLHLGLLKCFSKMGQLSSVLSQVEGLVTKVFGLLSVFGFQYLERSIYIAAKKNEFLLSNRLKRKKCGDIGEHNESFLFMNQSGRLYVLHYYPRLQ